MGIYVEYARVGYPTHFSVMGVGTAAPVRLFHIESDSVTASDPIFYMNAKNNGENLVVQLRSQNAAGIGRNFGIECDPDSEILRIGEYSGAAVENTLVLSRAGGVGMGTGVPYVSAILDLTSTTKAFLPPRMTTAQRNAIAAPSAGMVVYNTTTNALDFYNGAAWGAV